MYAIRFIPWDCSSIGQSTALSRRKLRVRAPSVPMDINTIKKILFIKGTPPFFYFFFSLRYQIYNINNKVKVPIDEERNKKRHFGLHQKVKFFYLVWIKDLPMLYY